MQRRSRLSDRPRAAGRLRPRREAHLPRRCSRAANAPFVVAEENRERVEQLRAGTASPRSRQRDASEPAVLIQAHVAQCAHCSSSRYPRHLPRAPHDRDRARAESLASRSSSARTAKKKAALLQQQRRAGIIFIGEQELAKSMAHVAKEIA